MRGKAEAGAAPVTRSEADTRGVQPSICAIMQPTFLPWLGYFDLMDQVDAFVFLDDVQVATRSWATRNRIKTRAGVRYVRVPIRKAGPRACRTFANAQIDTSQRWQRTLIRTLAVTYARAPHLDSVLPDLAEILLAGHQRLADLNISIIMHLAAKCGIGGDWYRSSELPGITGRKDDRLVSICRALGASSYLAARGSAAYIEAHTAGGAFPRAAIGLRYHDYDHPEYRQPDPPFASHMSIIDMLMHCGYGEAREIIRSGRKPSISYETMGADATHDAGSGAEASVEPGVV